MQLLVDTKADSDVDLASALRLLQDTLALRGVVLPDDLAPVGLAVHGDVVISGKVTPVIVQPPAAASPDAARAAFGQPAPLPAGALEIDLPPVFTPAPPVPVAPALETAAAAPSTEVQSPAPAAAASPAATANAAVSVPCEEDSAGYRWDARIHADTKTKIKADGTWKLKRGIDRDLVAKVRAELRAAEVPDSVPAGTLPAAPPVIVQPAAAAPVADLVAQPSPPVVAPPPPVFTQPNIPAAPSAMAVVAPAAPITGAPANYRMDVIPQTFSELMAFKAAPAVQAGRLSSPDLLKIAQDNGVDSLQALVTSPAKVPDIAKAIDRRLGLSA